MILDNAPPAPALRHDLGTILLHWGVAGLLVILWATGWGHEVSPRGPIRGAVVDTHASLGFAALWLVLLRVAWAWLAAPGQLKAERTRLATLMHQALYAAMILVPLAGIGMVWGKGKAVSLFGFASLAPPFPANRALAKGFEKIHEVSAWLLTGLVAGHIGAALWHHYVLRDGLINRMRVGRGSRQSTNSEAD